MCGSMTGSQPKGTTMLEFSKILMNIAGMEGMTAISCAEPFPHLDLFG